MLDLKNVIKEKGGHAVDDQEILLQGRILANSILLSSQPWTALPSVILCLKVS